MWSFPASSSNRLVLKRIKSVSFSCMTVSYTHLPRTLAMTLYGDLDVSVIDELPPGRKPVSYTHLDVYKRQGDGNGFTVGHNDRTADAE